MTRQAEYDNPDVDRLRVIFNAETDSELAERIKKPNSTIARWRKKGVPAFIKQLIEKIS